MSYIAKYKITPDKMVQQFIDPEIVNIAPAQYECWLRERAERLAKEGNAFLAELKGHLI